MGKNHRHSKKLKSEKNKVHIKSKTKFLPKGQNVTNTSFKIKAIVVQEQLKERGTPDVLGRKRVNFEELISKLKHFNDTIKCDSCQELKEAITSNPVDIVQMYLSSLIQNASALIQDRERKVRRASIKLLSALFEKISFNTLRPFFGYILTNLKCAMTNINKHIQEDSLLLLDAILEQHNSLIAENFNIFFTNFLMLISKLKNQSTERSLSLSLEGKVTSVKWRVKVLARLYGVLNSMIQSRPKNNTNFDHSLNVKNVAVVPLYSDISCYETSDLELFKKSVVDSGLNAQILNFTQILHEIWLEIVPEKKKGVSGATVFTTDEAIAVFISVVNILRLVQEYAQDSGNETTFTQVKCILFLESLMSNFPYTHNKKNLEIAKEFPKYLQFSCDQNCVEENLTIIYIYITLRIKYARNVPKHKSVGTYLNRCLQFRLTPTSFRLLVKILKEITLEHPFLCRKIGVDETELLENIYNFYKKVPLEFEDDVLEILMNSRSESSQTWMEKLPSLLCEKRVSVKLVGGVLDLCRKGNVMVQNSVRSSIPDILANVSNLEVSGETFASIFFYLPNLESVELRRFISVNPHLSFSKHLENILDLRSYMSK